MGHMSNLTIRAELIFPFPKSIYRHHMFIDSAMALPQMPDDEDHVKDADRAKDGDNEDSEDGEVVERILGARRGHVLTVQSILKSEHFPMLGTRLAKLHIQNSGLEVKERAASSSMSHADDSGEFCPCPPMDHSKLAAVQASVPKTMARTMTTMMNVHGAPNFRCAPSTPVYGVAQPTVSGLRSLQRLLLSATDTTEDDANYAIGANDATDSDGKRRRLLTWICIRDEPVVYLDGLPMVLREARRPLENMRAFTGISAERVEALESRLVQDIRDEMNCHDGLIVVHEEHGIWTQFQCIGPLIDTVMHVMGGGVCRVAISPSILDGPAHSADHAGGL
jgi:hypothetical protein